MREMPHGQWVPFEDYDTVHKCDKQFAEFQTNKRPSGKYPFQRRSYDSQNRQGSESSGCLTILLLVILVISTMLAM